MHLDDALDQIATIRGQIARSEVYRGTRAGTMAATALIANIAAWMQPAVVSRPDLQPNLYTAYWVAAAILAFAVVGVQISITYIRCPHDHERATTRAAVACVAPPLAAGAAVTAVFALRGAHEWLPGLWPIFISLALFGLRTMLPRVIGIVALAYAAAGAWILLYLRGADALAPWVMGSVFTAGQSAGAIVLYWNLERSRGEE
ncbi:MAG: hypothetical protein HY286_08255 [Planctomycetes bacterium]|nr:hypothetical protein [Planctomycetota bacterium]